MFLRISRHYKFWENSNLWIIRKPDLEVTVRVSQILPFLLALPLMACEPVVNELSQDESEMAYSIMVDKVSPNLGSLQMGALDETYGCAPSGEVRYVGEVTGTGQEDAAYILDVTASSCAGMWIMEDGSEVELTMDGGPINVDRSPEGGLSSSGSVSWSTPDGRSGTCNIFGPPADGESGGCE